MSAADAAEEAEDSVLSPESEALIAGVLEPPYGEQVLAEVEQVAVRAREQERQRIARALEQVLDATEWNDWDGRHRLRTRLRGTVRPPAPEPDGAGGG